MKLSNILYTSAFTIALGAAAPLAIADNTGTYHTPGGTNPEGAPDANRSVE